jgi:hypothetical protein
MIRKMTSGIVVISLILIIVSCTTPSSAAVPAQKPAQAPGPGSTTTTTVIPTTSPPPASVPKPPGALKEKWLEPQVSGDTVSIPVSDVRNNWNTAFKMVNKGSTLNFMAYVLNDEIQVRANVCPPCKSIGYTLNNDVLVCDTCGTTFRATNGSGIQGACVKFPKAAIQYKVVNDAIVMNINDLVSGYQKTLSGNG